MTAGRTAGVAAAAAVGFGVGFYLGVFLLLSLVGLDEFQGWQFPLATVPTGGLVGGAAAAAVTPGRPWLAVVSAAVVAGAVVTGIVYVVDGDFGVAFLLGAAAVAVAGTVAGRKANRTA